MTSILITSDTEVEVPEPLVELDGVDPAWGRSCSTEFESQDREREILTQLRLEHINMEEKKTIVSSMLSLLGHILFTW